MNPLKGAEELIKAKYDLEKKRVNAAKLAYKSMKAAIAMIEDAGDKIEIKILWDECVMVDNELYQYRDLEE